jgi:hypothetical protein
MVTQNLDAHEIELIVLALRFWRSQRGAGETRRTDAVAVAPDDVDFLLAKLQNRNLSAIAAGARESQANRRLR